VVGDFTEWEGFSVGIACFEETLEQIAATSGVSVTETLLYLPTGGLWWINGLLNEKKNHSEVCLQSSSGIVRLL